MYIPVPFKQLNPAKNEFFTINKFLGVDFRRGDYVENKYRSPDALNTIWSNNPYVFQTRTGIKRVLANRHADSVTNVNYTINGIHIYEPENEILYHADTELYRLINKNGAVADITAIMNGECKGEIVATLLNNAPSKSFMMNGKLYILGAGVFLQYDGISVSRVDQIGYIPKTITNRKPSGGGQVFEAVNLLSSKRINGFVPTSEPQEVIDTFSGYAPQKEFYLSVKENITYDEIIVKVNGDIKQLAIDYEIDRVNAKVVFNEEQTDDVEITYFADDINNPVWINEYVLDSQNIGSVDKVIVNGVELEETTNYTVDLTKGVVTFVVAPEAQIGGVESVFITFTKEIDGHADQINKCTIFGIFGGENDTRVFLSGNPDAVNKDWSSALYDPTYFPENGFTYIGVDNTAIMGYVKQYDTQMIIKEGNQQDGSAFLRTFEIDQNSEAYFPVEQGAVGIGAISKETFAYLQGEPLFLSSQGVVGVTGTNVDNQRLIQDRSELVNSVLVNELDLDKAIGIEFGNKYYLFINGKVFICDYRMRYQDELGNIQYEWMYWENIKASCVTIYTIGKDRLMLVGADGMIFRFMNDNELNCHLDQDAYGNTKSIKSHWTTPNLYFGGIANKKRLNFIYFLLNNKSQTDIEVVATINSDRKISLGDYFLPPLLDFRYINWRLFSFLTQYPTFTVKKKAGIERFDNIQLKIATKEDDEISSKSFGLEVLQIEYQVLNN